MSTTYGKESDLNLKLWVVSNRFNLSIHRELLKTFKKYGLSTSQFAVLEVLYHKGDLTVGEIIDKILITGGNITLVIKNLEQKNYLTINPDTDDGRKRIISITKDGEEVVSKAFLEHLDVLNDLLDVFNSEQKEKLIELLKLGNENRR